MTKADVYTYLYARGDRTSATLVFEPNEIGKSLGIIAVHSETLEATENNLDPQNWPEWVQQALTGPQELEVLTLLGFAKPRRDEIIAQQEAEQAEVEAQIAEQMAKEESP